MVTWLLNYYLIHIWKNKMREKKMNMKWFAFYLCWQYPWRCANIQHARRTPTATKSVGWAWSDTVSLTRVIVTPRTSACTLQTARAAMDRSPPVTSINVIVTTIACEEYPVRLADIRKYNCQHIVHDSMTQLHVLKTHVFVFCFQLTRVFWYIGLLMSQF